MFDYAAEAAAALLDIARQREYIKTLRKQRAFIEIVQIQEDDLQRTRLFRLRYALRKAVEQDQITQEEADAIIVADRQAQKEFKKGGGG